MSNELVEAKNIENKQLERVVEYFDNQGIIDFFVENLGYSPESVSKKAVEFMIKIKNQDLKNRSNEKYKPLDICSSISKQQVFMKLLAWDLPSDDRDFFYLYNENGNLTCEASYKGLKYVAWKNGVTITEGLIFDGDDIAVEESSDGDKYSIKRGNPFGRKDIKGCFVFAERENRKPKLYLFSFDELEAGRQASKRKMFGKESPAWQYFPNDMYLKVGIKKACKLALSDVEIKQEVRAIFDDEVLEVETKMLSSKTDEFESQKKEKTDENN